MSDPDQVQHYDRETGELTVHPYGAPCDHVDPRLGPCRAWPRWTDESADRDDWIAWMWAMTR